MRDRRITGPVRREDLPPAATLEAGVNWLRYDERYLLRLKRARNALLGASAVALLALIVALVRSSPGLPAKVVGVMVAGIVLCLVAMYFQWRRGAAPAHFVGVDGAALVLRTKQGEVRRVPLGDVRTDGSTLVAGPTVIVYRTAAGDAFQGREIESVLLSRLPPEVWLSPGALWRWVLRRQQPRAFVPLAILAILFVAAVAWLAAMALG
jgi:hypothetical protein